MGRAASFREMTSDGELNMPCNSFRLLKAEIHSISHSGTQGMVLIRENPDGSQVTQDADGILQ